MKHRSRIRIQKYLFLVFLTGLTCITAWSQDWQQQVDYDINVSLDTAQKILTGHMTMTYHNNSPQSLSEIQLHLWNNAYKDKGSFFDRQNLASNNSKFYWATEEEQGGYKDIEFMQNGTPISWKHVRNNIEYVTLPLQDPLAPGKTTEIQVNFTSKIPYIFSRGGWAPHFFALTQWFPKAAVYDREGWHLFPYLEMGEYYSEFGDYKVTIEVPKGYKIGATGVMTDSTTLDSARIQQTYQADKVLDFAWFAGDRMISVHKSITLENGHPVDLHYYAPKNYPLNDNKVADSLVPQIEGVVNNNLDPIEMLERAVRFYSDQVAPYPYPQVSVVVGPLNTGSGMEYPMITLVGPTPSAMSLDRVITHEVGHNWFQGILGFNERQSPYLDEGINSFYENKYMGRYYNTQTPDFRFMYARTDLDFNQFLYLGAYQRGDLVPVNASTNDMDMIQYYFNGYMIPPSLFEKLEDVTGPEQFRKNMKDFYNEHKFSHPTIEDIQRIFIRNDPENRNFDWFFRDLLTTLKPYDIAITDVKTRGNEYEVILENRSAFPSPVTVKAFDGHKVVESRTTETFLGTKTVSFPIDDYDYFAVDPDLVIEQTPSNNKYEFIPVRKQKFLNPVAGLNNPGINKIWFDPYISYNYTDGATFGLGLHNITLPGNNFEFYVQPGYGVKSSEWVGLAGMDYFIPRNNSSIRYFNFGWSARRYSYFSHEEAGYLLNYIRLNPHFKISFQALNKFSPWYKTLIISAPIVNQQIPAFDEFGAFTEKDDFWRIYPRVHYRLRKYSPVNNIEVNLKSEFLSYEGFQNKSQNYLKTSAELKTDYAYAPDQRIYARFFLGGFPVNSARNIGSVGNYLVPGTLGMSSQAYNDYAFDGYFLDRSEMSNGLLARQIRMEDGGFKNYLGSSYAQVTGNSNSFLGAVNLSLDLPFIGKKVPIMPYLDLGIYDDATPSGNGTTFLYSGGVQFGRDKWPLAIYLPLFGSEEIMNIHKERGNLWKRLSFRMSLENFGVSEKLRDTPLSQVGIFQ